MTAVDSEAYANAVKDTLGDYAGAQVGFADGDPDSSNGSSKAAHWIAGMDEQHADSVDIAVWTGHTMSETKTLVFINELDENEEPQPEDQISASVMSLGETDTEWVVFNTCYFMGNPLNNLRSMMGGARMILGYAGDMQILSEYGQFFVDDLANGVLFERAWADAAQEMDPEKAIPMILATESTIKDRLPGAGPTSVRNSPDSGSDDVVVLYDYSRDPRRVHY